VDDKIEKYLNEHIIKTNPNFLNPNNTRNDTCSSERSTDDWDVFIAHFLGVDHIGNTSNFIYNIMYYNYYSQFKHIIYLYKK